MTPETQLTGRGGQMSGVLVPFVDPDPSACLACGGSKPDPFRQCCSDQCDELARGEYPGPSDVPVAAPARPLTYEVIADGEGSLLPVEYVVEDLLVADGDAVLFGETGTGKTFLALDLAVHVAADRTWRGKEVNGGSVVYIYAEGRRALEVRKHAAKGNLGLAEGETLPIISVPQRIPFGGGAAHRPLIEMIKAKLEANGWPPVALVIVDTLTANAAGDGDSNAEAASFFRDVQAFRVALNREAASITIHHPGHGDKKRSRGAYDIKGGRDGELLLEGDGSGQLTLTVTKQRDGERVAPLGLALKKVGITVDGAPLYDSKGKQTSTLVVVPSDRVPRIEVNPDAALRASLLMGLPVLPAGIGLGALAAKLGKGKEAISRELNRLKRDGIVDVTPGRKRDSIVWGQVSANGLNGTVLRENPFGPFAPAEGGGARRPHEPNGSNASSRSDHSIETDEARDDEATA